MHSLKSVQTGGMGVATEAESLLVSSLEDHKSRVWIGLGI